MKLIILLNNNKMPIYEKCFYGDDIESVKTLIKAHHDLYPNAFKLMQNIGSYIPADELLQSASIDIESFPNDDGLRQFLRKEGDLWCVGLDNIKN